MFDLYADKTQLTVREKELVTSGSVNAYLARFSFSDDWEGLTRTAVFMSGCRKISVLLGGDGECKVPWELLRVPGMYLFAGVYGTDASGTVLPTVWANLGVIQEGASPGPEAQPSIPELWEEGVTDHRQLSHRDAEGQHTIESIAGLSKELERIPEPAEALSNSELEVLLK